MIKKSLAGFICHMPSTTMEKTHLDSGWQGITRSSVFCLSRMSGFIRLTQQELHHSDPLSGRTAKVIENNRLKHGPLESLVRSAGKQAIISRITSIGLQWFCILKSHFVEVMYLLNDLVVDLDDIIRLDVCRLVLFEEEELISEWKQSSQNRFLPWIQRSLICWGIRHSAASKTSRASEVSRLNCHFRFCHHNSHFTATLAHHPCCNTRF